MPTGREKIVADLIDRGRRLLNEPRGQTNFGTGIAEAEVLLNDIELHPHIFVLACVMDRQVAARRAWLIPYEIGKEIGSFDFEAFLAIKPAKLTKMFAKKRLHRFNAVMATLFYKAIQTIHTRHKNDASRIWSGTPKSAAVMRRFIEFDGVGIKIASMATNILARDFKIPMTNYSSIDISPDRQVRKYFVHHGLIRKEASNDELMLLARELHHEFPGILDVGAFFGGRELGRKRRTE